MCADPKRGDALKLRVIEHNTMVAAKFYSDIRMHRLSQLLDLSSDDVSGGCSQIEMRTQWTKRKGRKTQWMCLRIM